VIKMLIERAEHFGDWVIRAGHITAVERGGQHGAMHEGCPEEDDE
jgi:hypothetical protein